MCTSPDPFHSPSKTPRFWSLRPRSWRNWYLPPWLTRRLEELEAARRPSLEARRRDIRGRDTAMAIASEKLFFYCAANEN